LSLATDEGIASSPALGPDGTLFVGTDRDHVLVVSPNGTLIREVPVGGPVRGSVVVTASGDFLVPSEDGALYAFNSRAVLLWKTPGTSAIDSSPALGQGLIFYGAFDHALHAVDLQGNERWIFKTGGPVTSSAALGGDGTVWIGSEDGKLYAIGHDGALVWSFATQGAISSSPAIGPLGEVAVGSRDGSVYLFR
jgi:outer membrane protein assembly factor BamB